MKRMFFVIIALAMMFAGGVQQVYAKGKAAPVRALEFEIGAGMVSPTNKLDFDKNRVGYNINAELRCNFKTHPFDIGLRVDGGTFPGVNHIPLCPDDPAEPDEDQHHHHDGGDQTGPLQPPLGGKCQIPIG